MHQAHSCRKWRLMVKNAKMEKSDLTLPTFVQDVEVFQDYCVVNKLQRSIPRKHSKRLREEEEGHTKREKHKVIKATR